MQEDILEKYYKDVFGKYEGMPAFSELTQDQKYYMKNSLMYSRYKASIEINELVSKLRNLFFGFIEKLFHRKE
jgi:hypothetical protein